MLLGIFKYVNSGVGHLHQTDSTLTKEQHLSCLQRHATPSGLHLSGKGFILQQDNEPKHTSWICKNYLKAKEDQGVLTYFPAQSQDLNHTEHFWGHLQTKKAKHSVISQKALWNDVRSWGIKAEGGALCQMIS